MNSVIAFETIADYRFHPDDLKPQERQPGISAFMRIRNGADFLQATVRSHIAYFDEIVAVYSQSTDATPEILAQLQNEFGPKLRVFHYLPATFPPGSTGHIQEPPNSPHSFVNMSNFALTRTRHTIAIKLDDDHLAMGDRVAAMVAGIAKRGWRLPFMHCFAGINISRDDAGRLGVPVREPFSGGGDVSFFEVTPETHFIHDPRHETFRRGGMRREFRGFAYWHLKYLKRGFGFANAGIERGNNPRFARKRQRFMADRRVVPLSQLTGLAPKHLSLILRLPMAEKQRLVMRRWQELCENPPTETDFDNACREVDLDLRAIGHES